MVTSVPDPERQAPPSAAAARRIQEQPGIAYPIIRDRRSPGLKCSVS